MDATFWKKRLGECPALRPWLTPIARRIVRGENLPSTLTLGPVPEDKAVRQALCTLFPVFREDKGRFRVRLTDDLRASERWQSLAEALGFTPPVEADGESDALFAQSLLRLKILHPSDGPLIDALRAAEATRRFFRSTASAPNDLLALFDALERLRETPAGITLSELGAASFNDSKALRTGARRQQLEHLLRLQTGLSEDDPPNAVLSAAGIVENPYTTHVVVFAPFAYRADDGAWLDWPRQLWLRGEAAVLSWEAVRSIQTVRLEPPLGELVTSENAAPFHRLVDVRRAALYTEGYPNAAVKTLLRLLAAAGVSALHWGDTDLDGYRIAEQIARAIPTRLFAPPPSHAQTLGERRLPLTPDQRRRAEAFAAKHPEFPHLAALRDTLAHGWLEQEHTIACFT